MVEQALTELGARPWQIALVAPGLAAALLEKEPVPVPEAPAGEVTENTPEEA